MKKYTHNECVKMIVKGLITEFTAFENFNVVYYLKDGAIWEKGQGEVWWDSTVRKIVGGEYWLIFKNCRYYVKFSVQQLDLFDV